MTKKILALPGDGIGREVMDSTLNVLNYLIKSNNLDFLITKMNVGGAAYDLEGHPIPDAVLEEAKKSDAILFGAVGGEKWDDLEWDLRPENALLTLRKELNLFANLRPAFLFNELSNASPIKKEIINNLDILIVRELTGGVYFGEPRGLVSDVEPGYAFNTMIYNEDEIRRIANVAFEAAQKRNGKLCSVDKANVLEVSQLWRDTVEEIMKNHPDIEFSNMYVDNAAMQLVRDPSQFDVIVTNNLFGDILSDLAAMLSGSIGMLPSASLSNDGPGVFEPVHGSAPDIAGKDIANPIAMALSTAMMLRIGLNEPNAADNIELAIDNVLSKGFRTSDLIDKDAQILSCTEMGEKIIQEI